MNLGNKKFGQNPEPHVLNYITNRNLMQEKICSCRK